MGPPFRGCHWNTPGGAKSTWYISGARNHCHGGAQRSAYRHLTYGYLLASSDGHGFSYWLFLTAIVAVTLGAFCVMPYALVRGTIRSR
ncbi:hypothetical protein AB0F11_13530 [Streptomyces sp. NPDC032472]|uniref:hypothetical protein n=1 Tax=Streptomyces sp. NPDC032472 TaxID=3155018 RepID=UPI0033D5CE2D